MDNLIIFKDNDFACYRVVTRNAFSRPGLPNLWAAYDPKDGSSIPQKCVNAFLLLQALSKRIL
jgi:hypothetical protein